MQLWRTCRNFFKLSRKLVLKIWQRILNKNLVSKSDVLPQTVPLDTKIVIFNVLKPDGELFHKNLQHCSPKSEIIFKKSKIFSKKYFLENLLWTREMKFCTNLPNVFRQKSFFNSRSSGINETVKKILKPVVPSRISSGHVKLSFDNPAKLFRQIRNVFVASPKKSENWFFC